jgi:hypothetical protein
MLKTTVSDEGTDSEHSGAEHGGAKVGAFAEGQGAKKEKRREKRSGLFKLTSLKLVIKRYLKSMQQFLALFGPFPRVTFNFKITEDVRTN